jgi:hypothetical protein
MSSRRVRCDAYEEGIDADGGDYACEGTYQAIKFADHYSTRGLGAGCS